MSESTQNTENKLRKSLSLDPEIVRQGEALAVMEKRSFSNEIEVLIEREFQRVSREAAKENAKEVAA